MNVPNCGRCSREISPDQGFAVYSEASEGISDEGRLVLTTANRGGIQLGAMLYCESCANQVFVWKVWENAKALNVEMDPEDALSAEGKDARSEVLDFSIALRAKRRGLTAAQAFSEAREVARLWWTDEQAARQRLNAPSLGAQREPQTSKNLGVNVSPDFSEDCWFCGSTIELRGRPIYLPMSANSRRQGSLRTWDALTVRVPRCARCRQVQKWDLLVRVLAGLVFIFVWFFVVDWIDRALKSALGQTESGPGGVWIFFTLGIPVGGHFAALGGSRIFMRFHPERKPRQSARNYPAVLANMQNGWAVGNPKLGLRGLANVIRLTFGIEEQPGR